MKEVLTVPKTVSERLFVIAPLIPTEPHITVVDVVHAVVMHEVSPTD
jgi:hypothetical protein